MFNIWHTIAWLLYYSINYLAISYLTSIIDADLKKCSDSDAPGIINIEPSGHMYGSSRIEWYIRLNFSRISPTILSVTEPW